MAVADSATSGIGVGTYQHRGGAWQRRLRPLFLLLADSGGHWYLSLSRTPTRESIPAVRSHTAVHGDGYLHRQASTQNVTTAAHWMSSDTSVATIVNYGVVNGASTGTTTITAAVGTVSATATLVVTPGRVGSYRGNGQIHELFRWAWPCAIQAAIGLYTDGSTVDLTNSVTWMSDQTKCGHHQ